MCLFKHKNTCKQVILLLTMGFTILLLVACNNNITENTTSGQASSQETEAQATTIIDREGNEVVVPETVQKIVSLAPSITETLIHLGLTDKIVAVDVSSEGLVGLPVNLPTYDLMSPDVESIIALQPDLILATNMSKSTGDDPFAMVVDLGAFVTYIPTATSIKGIKEDLIFIGQVTHTRDKMKEIITEMERTIDDIVLRIQDAETKKGERVYFEIAAAPQLYSFGNGTFLHEMIELLEATNILADQDSWISVSEEAVIAANPDVIFTNVNYIETPLEEIMDRAGWQVVDAVKEKRIYEIDNASSSSPNEFITIALQQMAQALYPDLFV